ncbi:uncharacterized protein LOC127467540 isoform X3 [Manacus candei]|uniref:uncharacterized protein LOC127467540 isoform X3 n=1 Tax=Manacus candei TaxID=415023 RepID=UPI002226E667|nr:uncharacterized protein LOC127467540 isoform X3 [Manacus candei]
MMNEWPIILCFVPIEAVHLYLPMKIKLTAKGQSGTRTAASKLKDKSVARGTNFRRRHIVIPSLISFTMHSVQARIYLTVQVAHGLLYLYIYIWTWSTYITGIIQRKK